MSNLRVSVEWQTAAVFAGESVECAITFSNIAQSPDSNSTTAQTRDNHSARGPWKKPNSGNNALRPSVSSPRQGPNASVPRHRNTASLNRLRSRTSAAPGSSTQDHRQPDQVTTNGGHKRSVSIVSIAGDPTSTETKSHGIPASRRAGKGHGRAASLQILPGRSTVSTKSPSSGTYPFEPSVSMQRYSSASAYDPAAKKPAIFRSSTSSTLGNAQNAPELQSPSEEPASSLILTRPHGRTPSAGFSSSPRATQIPSSPATNVQPTPNKSTNDALGIRNLPQPPMQDQPNQVLDARGYLPRIFSSASNESTPRSSTHLYSASNNSSDTLASEYVNAEIGRGSHQPIPRQQRSQALPSKSRRAPEVLMMGYGSVVGNFNLDASLVNLTPFDEVKGKAVIGNQGGGGVVRAGSTKRQSGLLGSLGWSTLGESLGGLLGASEMSTIKEAVKSTDAKWFPLLSTPQSLLFTDLRLEPGRSQSYSFTYRLPPGLPPTYKGKALRVSYNLVIGVQRATQSTQQHLVRSVEFPFRVFPSVNGNGVIIGHDLKSPHVMLHSQPLTAPLNEVNRAAAIPSKAATHSESSQSEGEFLTYIRHILDMPRQGPGGGLLSPSATEPKSESATEDVATVESEITRAIQQSNAPMPSKVSANRFEIKRSGHRVAVIMLARPAYRLGEVIPIIVDLHTADIHCYSLHVTLETSERIDPTIAVRSQASISRISRKIHALQHESSISAHRMFFSLAIPNNATPEFVTSGVSLEWCLRCEFVTETRENDEQEIEEGPKGLLEEVAEDERGVGLAAVQAMQCEAFDVQLPLRVYGDRKGFDDNYRIQESPI